MSISWKIPRNCLAWVLIAQLALIAPHALRLPWWVIIAYGCCAIWRIMVFQGRWSFPPRSVKILLSLLCFFGIYRSYGTMIGMEPTVALLFSGFSLKLLELASKRDVYVILFLAYFVALTEFLFNQDFIMVVFVFSTVLIVSTALVALHQQTYEKFDFVSLKKTSILFLQALPLMVVIFIVFPRFDPLWKVPLSSSQAESGVSDTLSPGDISDLSQSSALAFRADFETESPPRSKLYWRGLVLSEFDGRTWRQGKQRKEILNGVAQLRILSAIKNQLRYSIVQEPTHQPWLFTLALAYSADSNSLTVSDYRLMRDGDIHSRIKYDVISDITASIELQLSELTRFYETRLPVKGNPRSRQFAAELYARSSSDRVFIKTILDNYFRENYYYTLKPPLLGEHSIDEFLFETRRGFCGHYASSFVFLMRAAGLPARVVSGYQGGEVNPITGTISVHQFDAHAWAEVWLSGEGWVRFDPTAMVAPDRIEYGLERAMEEEGTFLSSSPLSPLRYRNIAWLNSVRLQLDAFNYRWSLWVLQYKGKKQLDIMEKLLGKVNPLRVALFILGISSVMLSLIAFSTLRGRGKLKSTREVQLYLRLCRSLERAGFIRKRNEGPVSFAQRVTEKQHKWRSNVLAATRAFVSLSYEPLSHEQRVITLKLLKSEVNRAGYKLRITRKSRL